MVLAALVVAGCGGKPDETVSSATAEVRTPACVAGKQEACACPGGAKGAQSCKADGSGFDKCVCPEEARASGGGESKPEPAPTPEPPPNPDACVDCRSQEDFDAAGRKGRKCCPATLCTSDAGCGNRVCCRFPGGQMCADAGRCSGPNRVSPVPQKSREESCLATCPGGQMSHCYCVCVGQCPPD